MNSSDRSYVAGDDDQSIFKWAGASAEELIGLQGERFILDQSHRIPKKIHQAATSLIGRVKNRIPKLWKAKEDQKQTNENLRIHMKNIRKPKKTQKTR